MTEQRQRYRVTLKRPETDDPPDYSALHRREFEALAGVELIKARITRDGELVAEFYVSDSDNEAEARVKMFLDHILVEGEKPESINVEPLAGEIAAMPASNVVRLPVEDE
jgi:hypothetical protein